VTVADALISSVNVSAARLQKARLEIPDKLLKPTFRFSPYTARAPHTHLSKSPPLPGLAHWTNSKGLSAGRFRVGCRDPCPQKKTNERHPLGDLRVTLDRKRIVDFLVIIIESLSANFR